MQALNRVRTAGATSGFEVSGSSQSSGRTLWKAMLEEMV